MLRAMLVDDEPLSLEGLRLLIDWPAEGFTLCAECTSAMDALARIPMTSPDLIVTDIRIPGMNGLAFMRQAISQGYDGQFVVVSGYGDFEYAQQALSIGVAGYLLKPIEPREASAVLEHVRQMLVVREATSTQRRAELHRSLTDLLCGENAPASAALPNGYTWQVASWGAPLPFDQVREVLMTFPAVGASAHIVGDKEFIVVRWRTGDLPLSWEDAEVLLRHCHRKLLQAPPTQDVAELTALREQLTTALNANSTALADRVNATARTIALRQPDEFKKRCEELELFCAACGAEAYARAKHQLIAECARQLHDRPQALKVFLSAQYDSVASLGLLAIHLLTPDQERISDRVAAYVQTRYHQPLTLKGVADALAYNPTYLGRVFREEQAMGFGQWVSIRRMDLAAQLLRCTNDSVNDIADQVGYLRYKSFLAHFKRQFGQTPNQYRKQHKPHWSGTGTAAEPCGGHGVAKP